MRFKIVMSRLNHVERILGELGAEMGMAELSLDDSDRLSLLFDGSRVTFLYGAEPMELLWLYVDLGPVPDEGNEAPEFLLKAALIGFTENRMTVGLDARTNHALAHTVIPVALLERPLLKRVLSQLLEASKPIAARIAEGDFTVDTHVSPERGTEGPWVPV